MAGVVIASPPSSEEANGTAAVSIPCLPRRTAIEGLVLATFALLGFGIGARPLGDNSSFLHLRTGIEILNGRRVPTVDPYSFTAHGHPWVVQSWLASVAYGAAYRMAGCISSSS